MVAPLVVAPLEVAPPEVAVMDGLQYPWLLDPESVDSRPLSGRSWRRAECLPRK